MAFREATPEEREVVVPKKLVDWARFLEWWGRQPAYGQEDEEGGPRNNLAVALEKMGLSSAVPMTDWRLYRLGMLMWGAAEKIQGVMAEGYLPVTVTGTWWLEGLAFMATERWPRRMMRRSQEEIKATQARKRRQAARVAERSRRPTSSRTSSS